MPSKKRKKYKLLFDEGLPPPKAYPTLNNFHAIAHIALSPHRSEDDTLVYKLAEKEGRIPVVFNTKDFKRLISQNSTSVISLSTNLTNSEADLKIYKALKDLKNHELKGFLISISKSGITVKQVSSEEVVN